MILDWRACYNPAGCGEATAGGARMSQSDNRWVLKTAPVWSIPFLIPVSIVIGLGLGWWLDGKLGTKPWLAVVLAAAGLAAGIYESVRILIDVTRDDDNG